MLRECIDIQLEAVNSLVTESRFKDEITFKAPTGSGKTYMMADYMNRILESNDNVVFLVSSLSKGDLAQQNYEKFMGYQVEGRFSRLNPYLISSETSTEERLHIPEDYNVYVLPRDLYKQKSKLQESGAMQAFLDRMTGGGLWGGLDRKIWLIRDECHIETSALNYLDGKGYFDKIINFSATPKLSRGQLPDVTIKEQDAVNSGLIKDVVWCDDHESLEDAINAFERIKPQYIEKIGVKPCLIIQISNKDKATEELRDKIFPVLNKTEHTDLKWMLIVNQEKGKKDELYRECDTNDAIRNKLPVARWKEYAKENDSLIDIIIFKLAISEGWDIPRACMLYQIRDTNSAQLDEQVIGRVRRNPRLIDFEKLDSEARNLARKAWVWGVHSKDKETSIAVELREKNTVHSEFSLKTTRLRPLSQKKGFIIDSFIDSLNDEREKRSVFELYDGLSSCSEDVLSLYDGYVSDTDKWFSFASHIEAIKKEFNQYICDYEVSMQLTEDEDGRPLLFSFPINSFYLDNENYVDIYDWVWGRKDKKEAFSFDSEAERRFVELLKDLRVGRNSEGNSTIKQPMLSGSPLFLWGKNYPGNSEIKYEYYMDGNHFSYPDFIMKDSFDRIHLFEVKSLNSKTGSKMDPEEYKRKKAELAAAYLRASVLTGYCFYIPTLLGGSWHIWKYEDGKEDELTREQLLSFLNNKPGLVQR